MCGRYVSATAASKLAEEFHVDEVVVEDLGERYNVAPTLDVYTIVTTNDGHRRMGSLRWGLVPGFAKDEKIGNRMINLRTETVTDKPAFRKLLEKRRCIVPADGFYEWQATVDPGAQKPAKQPFYITSADGSPLAFAALWDRWTPPNLRGHEGVDPLRTVTLITGEPNELVAKIHNRMVVCLPEGKWDAWLDPGVGAEAAAAMLVPMPADQMRAYPVVKLVSNVKNEGPELLEPLPGH
ncbi:MAG: SOS response-associated peptidase [Actinobacteria bacterium]|nr:SOS response-associated peptidase [Actinomycetota bacterium]